MFGLGFISECMNEVKYKNAFQFLAGYFHEDFSIEFNNPEMAVKKFIGENDAAARSEVIRELQDVLSNYEGENLEKVILGLGCYYSPKKHRNISMEEWLKEVITQIGTSLT
jgi:RNase adaptor protein for sRNA GlmZ degradation